MKGRSLAIILVTTLIVSGLVLMPKKAQSVAQPNSNPRDVPVSMTGKDWENYTLQANAIDVHVNLNQPAKLEDLRLDSPVKIFTTYSMAVMASQTDRLYYCSPNSTTVQFTVRDLQGTTQETFSYVPDGCWT